MNIKISITKKGFIFAKWTDSVVTMQDILELGNELRRRAGLRPMSKTVLYRLRRALTDAWLDYRIKRFRHDSSKWRGNPYLAYRMIGPNYCFRHKNANYILTAMVSYRLAKQRGLPSLSRRQRKLRRLTAA